jgi:glycosyltransferase involved in cell wall biosynthesis
MHTRFETYPRYYGLGFLEPSLEALLRRFYRKCDAVVAPSESIAEVLRAQRMNDTIGIWTRGIDHTIFNPGQRDMAWRRALGLGDHEIVIGFIGRLVMEKGLDVFVETMAHLRAQNVPHRVLIVGEGPARAWFAERMPESVFTGFLMGQDLGRAVASMDVFFNPSITEAFGNVTNEAMACALPVVAAHATGSADLVQEGATGRLIPPGNTQAMADALAAYCTDDALRHAHGQAALASVAKYDWDSINQALVDTYLRVIDEHTKSFGPPKLGSTP